MTDAPCGRDRAHTALQDGLLDQVALEDIAAFRGELSSWLDREAKDGVTAIEQTSTLDRDQRAVMTAALTGLAARFARSHPAEPSGAG